MSVALLVNGLLRVQIEHKGIEIIEAFNQIIFILLMMWQLNQTEKIKYPLEIFRES
jgi:hypothetical protein